MSTPLRLHLSKCPITKRGIKPLRAAGAWGTAKGHILRGKFIELGKKISGKAQRS